MLENVILQLKILAIHEAQDNWSVDGKREFNAEKQLLAAELKLEMSEKELSISALPLGVTFQMSAHLLHLWTPISTWTPLFPSTTQVFDTG